MTGEQSSALQSFRRVKEFLGVHVPAGMPASFAGQVAELDAVLAELTRAAQQKEASTRLGLAEVHRQRAMRRTLWENHLLPLSRLAREIFGVPGMDAALRMPRKSADNGKLVSAARGMADAAERQRDVFAAHGMPGDFVEALRAVATELEGALTARVESGRERVEAQAGVKKLVKRGKRAVRMLDALLQPRLAGTPELVAAWKDAKRKKGLRGGVPVLVPVTEDALKVA